MAVLQVIEKFLNFAIFILCSGVSIFNSATVHSQALCLIVKRPCKPADIDKKSQPHKLAHLVLPDIPIAIGTNVPQNQKAYPVFLGGHFFAPESYCDTNQNTNFETN